MPPVYKGLICGVTTESFNETTTASDNEEFNALLYIVVTLLFYSLGIIVGIISYLKRERREMEEDKAFDDFLTWQIDPFTTIKAQRVQQVATRLRELEELKKKREMEMFQRELEIGAGSGAMLKQPLDNTTKKGHSLKIPKFNWTRSSGRRERWGSSEDYTAIPLQAVAGFTGIACQFVAPQYMMATPLLDKHSLDMKPASKHKLTDPSERRNCLQKTPRMMSRQERLQSVDAVHTDSAAIASSVLPFIDASPVEANVSPSLPT